jgi:DNA replication protein DnaC
MNIKILKDYIYICRNLDRKPTFQGFRKFKRCIMSKTNKYTCSECRDSGWVETDFNSFKRCKCADLNMIKECWENYGVKSEEVKTLEAYVPVNKAGASALRKAKYYIDNFDEISRKENNWLGIFGQPGSGKSHIIIAIGAALLNRTNKPVRVVYMPYLGVIRELKAKVTDDEKYSKFLSRYQKAEVLIIDDLFKDKVRKNKAACELTEEDFKHIYPVINYRYYNNLPTVFSSESTPNILLELDEALGGRILERCDKNIIQIPLKTKLEAI